jgi:transposase-like protein
MDDIRCYQFFQEPSDPPQRRYEAIRAVFVDGLSQKQAADRFGITHGALRKQIHEFREACHNGSPAPFFFQLAEEDLPRQAIRSATVS